MHSAIWRSSAVHGLLAVAFATSLFAQSKQAPASSLEPKAASDQQTPIELNPFEVREDQDRGYAAQNTVAGSRLNTSLMDTPAAISVFTTQFIEDIGATNVDDLVGYAVNTSNNVLDGTNNQLARYDPIISIRGISADGGGGRFTNFFPSTVTQDAFNIQRAELTRGPNSVLYGVGLPAGGFNVSTKKANVNRRSDDVSFRFGSYNLARGTIDLNQPLLRGKLALRLNGVDEDRNDWHPYAFKQDRRWAAALRWEPMKGARLDVEHERGQRHFATASGTGVTDALTPWIARGRILDTQVGAAFPADAGMIRNSTGNKLTYDMTTGTIWNLQNQSQGSPAGRTPGVPQATGEQARMHSDFSLVPNDIFLGGPAYGNVNSHNRTSVFASKEFFHRLSVEAAYNREGNHSSSHNPITGSGSQIDVDTNAVLPDGSPNPRAGQYYIDAFGAWVRDRVFEEDYRFTGSYQHDFSDGHGLLRWLGRHRFAGLFQHGSREDETSGQWSEYVTTNPLNTTAPDNAANQFVRRTYFSLDGPVGEMGMADIRKFPVQGMINKSTNLPIATQYLPNTQPRLTAQSTNTMLLVWQGHLLEDRLVPTIGYRKDRLAEMGPPDVVARGAPFGPFQQGPAILAQNTFKDFGYGITRTQGVVLHTVKWASLFTNHSSSFSLPPDNVRLFPQTFAASSVAAPTSTIGETDDFGGKFTLLGGKLYATITYYETQVKDQFSNGGLGTWKNGTQNIWNTLDAAGILRANDLSLDQVNAAPIGAQARKYDQQSQGWEFELIANPTPNWRLLLNYSMNKTIRTNTAPEILGYYNANQAFWTEGTRGRLIVGGTPGQLAATALNAADGVTTIAESLATQLQAFNEQFIAPQGVRALGVPVDQGNMRTNYSFREGLLRGTTMGLGIQYRGERVLSYTSSDPATRREIRSEAKWTTDANIGYRWNFTRFNRKFALNLQLNFTNLLNDRNVVYTQAYTDGVFRAYSIPAPRAWFMTSTLGF